MKQHAHITPQAVEDLMWWLRNLFLENWVHPPSIDFEMTCDASTGDKVSPGGAWGVVCLDKATGGAWDVTEQSYHINVRELIAIYYALRSFKNCCTHKHVKIYSDSTAAVGIVNKMGSSKSALCNQICKNLWLFCDTHNIWVTAAHIPGSKNIGADRESRKEYKEAEWKLNPKLFISCIQTLHFSPQLDCFASRLNTQLPDYVSFKPDPFAKFENAFSINWNFYKCYMFPPFSLIGRVLQKIRVDQAEVMIVVPHWPTQPWFTTFMEMLKRGPCILHPQNNMLLLPQTPGSVHPLAKNLKLMVGIVSGKNI